MRTGEAVFVVNLTCAGCGSVYPQSGVQGLDHFTCAVCRTTIVVPMAGPSEARRAPRTSPAHAAEEPPRAPVPAPAPAPATRAPAPTRARAAPAAPRAQMRSGGRMSSVRTKGVVAMAALGVVVLVDLALVATSLDQVGIAQDADARVPGTLDRAIALDARVADLTLAYLAAVAVAGTSFLVWAHGVHSNLVAARLRSLRFGAGWAVGGWFVPFLNLVRPAHVMAEAWRGSAYVAAPSERGRWQSAPASGLVAGWWTCMLLRCGLLMAGAAVLAPGAGASALILSGGLGVAGHVVSVAAALLAMELVRRIGEMQDRGRRRLVAARSGDRDE